MLAYCAIHIYRLYIIVRLRSKPRQLSITQPVIPIKLRQLSILSRLRSNHYSPTNYLTPTRLPARIQMWQLSITLRMLPIRSHALRKLHLLDFSLHYARDKSGVAFPRNLVG